MKKKVLSSCLALTLTLSMLATTVSATSVSAVSLVTDPPGRTGERVPGVPAAGADKATGGAQGGYPPGQRG